VKTSKEQKRVENQRAYDKHREKIGKPNKSRKKPEPRSKMQPVLPIMPYREWIDTPEDRAEIAAILARRGGAK